MKIEDLKKDLGNKNVHVELKVGRPFKYDEARGRIDVDGRIFVVEKDNKITIFPFENILWIDISDKNEATK